MAGRAGPTGSLLHPVAIRAQTTRQDSGEICSCSYFLRRVSADRGDGHLEVSRIGAPHAYAAHALSTTDLCLPDFDVRMPAGQVSVEGQRLALAQLETNPQQGEARAFLAYCRARLGDRTGAKNDAAWALKVWPGDNQVIRNTFLTYVALGDQDDALNALRLGTAKLAEELDAHPDLAEFRKNLRFKEWIDKKHKEQKNKGG